uniref:Cilia- and flagella-associated protein 263 n=1 Tax=Heterosigma akashiwo TaxID=2829 RepID=A0A7S3XQG1_HETAK
MDGLDVFDPAFASENIGAFDGGEDEELLQKLERVEREMDSLNIEVGVLESYYNRHSQEMGGEDEANKRRWRVAAGKKAPLTLTIEQKCEIANAELDESQREIEETKRNSEKLIDTLRAVLEETSIRISELKRDAYEFKRDIVVGAENMRTGRTVAEKVVRYMEDKLRQRDAMIEKLRLKNATLKNQIQKVENQLRQKEEMGDVLHYIDFHQLQIENKQHIAKIEERNEELLKLKMTTGKAVQSLNNLKNQLQKLTSESNYLNKEIAARTEQLEKIFADNEAVAQEIAAERKARRRAAQQQADLAELPRVEDYVAQKKLLYELQDTFRNWSRKVEIAEMEAKRAKVTARRAKKAAEQGYLY